MVKFSRILIAVMFILSAIAKLLSLEFFDQLIAEFFLGKTYYENIDSMFFTQLFARILIVGELILGMAVLQNHLLKKVVLPSILAILILFTAHLIFTGFQTKFIGGNCGCFGDIIPLDNFESIVKNIVVLFLALFVYYKHNESQRFDSWVPSIVLGVVSFGVLWLTIRDFHQDNRIDNSPQLVDTNLPLVLHDSLNVITPQSKVRLITLDSNDSVDKSSNVKSNPQVISPVNVTEVPQIENSKKDITVLNSFSSLLSKYTDFSGKSNVQLNKGHKLVCLYSLTCGHCQQAYKELYQMDRSGKLPDMYLICYGQQFDKFYFFNQGGGEKPNILLTDKHEFDILMKGESFPKILDMKDGKILQKWDISTYNKESVATYYNIELNKSEKVEKLNSITTDEEEEYNPFK